MKNFPLGAIVLLVLAAGAPALADPAAPAPPAAPDAPAAPAVPSAPAPSTPAAPSASPSTYTAPDATIHGRAAKPQVLIELARPTPASAARDAHEQMRLAWLKKLQPSTTRSVR